jgi:transcriptional regulator
MRAIFVNWRPVIAPSQLPLSPPSLRLHLTFEWNDDTSFARQMEKNQEKTDILQGTLDLMVLQTLDSLGPLHGYAIAARVEQVSKGALQLNMGTLYPALMRLEQRGLLEARWGTSDNNRRARFYDLTRAGRRELAREKEDWERMTTIMQALLRGEA